MKASASQAFYVEYFTLNKQWKKISVAPDGSGIAVPRTEEEAIYKSQVMKAGQDLDKLLQCDDLNMDGQDAIRKLAALSKEQHISIVFYRSTVNNDFYRFTKKKPAAYWQCERKFNLFMEQIQIEAPNIFYVDLSHYAPISSGGQDLFIDSHHLNSIGAKRVLEVLTPTIQEAIEYARSK
jgi:hypothetical protein